jgi:FlaA1/EpsC-like NDP-sugar epimerase
VTLMVFDVLPFALLAALSVRAHALGGIDLRAIAAFAATVVAVNATVGRYVRSAGGLRPHAIRSLLGGYAAATVGASAATLVGSQPLDGLELVLSWALLPFWLWLARALSDRHRVAAERVLIVGGGSIARGVSSYLASTSDAFELVGYINEGREAATEPPSGDYAILGSLADLPAVVAEQRVDRVIVAFPSAHDEATMRAVRACDALLRSTWCLACSSCSGREHAWPRSGATPS